MESTLISFIQREFSKRNVCIFTCQTLGEITNIYEDLIAAFIFYSSYFLHFFNSFYFFNLYPDNSRFNFYAHNSPDFEDFYKTGTLR